VEEMPSWVSNSDVHRVEWLNALLAKLWASVSESTEAVIMESLQPVLDSYRPSYFNSLGFSRITLGTIAPVITGIRNSQTSENCVRLDLELKWAGNPEVRLTPHLLLSARHTMKLEG
jgi:Ca2+-dependent lipid-binding protein